MNTASTSANAATTIDHPDARTGIHDIMDGSAGHNLDDPTDHIYHVSVSGTVWPGMVLHDNYVVTECYEEYTDEGGDPVFRWFCKPINA